MMLLKKLDAIRHEAWLEIKPYALHLVALFIVLYFVHQILTYWIQRKAVKDGVVEALKAYEQGKKNS